MPQMNLPTIMVFSAQCPIVIKIIVSRNYVIEPKHLSDIQDTYLLALQLLKSIKDFLKSQA